MTATTIKGWLQAATPRFLKPYWEKLEASPLGYRLARGVFWSMAGAMISRGLMLVATIAVARMLGKTGYGELGMIQSTVGMFGVFAGFGLGLTATKHVAQFRQSDPARAGRILGLSSLMAAVSGGLMAFGLFLFAPWLAERTINAPHLAGLLRIGSLILLVGAINGAQTGALAGFEAFKTIARVNLSVGVLSFPILIGGAYFGGLTGAVWALAINLGINWLINHIALRKVAARNGVPFALTHCRQEWPVLWRFSLPAFLAGSMSGPVAWACTALLVNQPNGYGEMGIYNAANQWFAMLLFLPTMLGHVVLPMLSQQMAGADATESTRTLGLSIKVNVSIVMPLAVIGSIFSPYIMRLYGASFHEGWPTLVVVLFTAGLCAASAPVGHILAASGRMWVGLAMNSGWAVTFLLGTALLLQYGALGVALAQGLAYFLHTVWVFAFAVHILKRNSKPTNPS